METDNTNKADTAALYSHSKKYCARLEGSTYYIYRGKAHVRTPERRYLRTEYLPIARRLLSDLDLLALDGEDEYEDEYAEISGSSVSWQCTYLDNFTRIRHKDFESLIIAGALGNKDWTYGLAPGADWKSIAGRQPQRAYEIMVWLHKCTKMQLNAVFCLSRGLESLNAAYMLARLIETVKPEACDKEMNALAEIFMPEMLTCTKEDLLHDFDVFELYYGIDLAKNGPIIDEEQ